MGDDLKFIDFYQLQIENKKYVKEIDEKNKKLLALKISTSKENWLVLGCQDSRFLQKHQNLIFFNNYSEK